MVFYHNKARLGMLICIALSIIALNYLATRKNKVQAVFDVLNRYRLPSDAGSVDAGNSANQNLASKKNETLQGTAECLTALTSFIQKNEPLPLLLVGFPFKSENHEKKTIGSLPDMAERKSLEYLQQLCNDLKKVYAPGAQLMIVCDGSSFAQFFQVSEKTLAAYELALKQLVSDLPNIKLYTTVDFLQKNRLKSAYEIGEYLDRYHRASDNRKPSDLLLKRLQQEFDYPAGKTFIAVTAGNIENLALQFIAREDALRNYIAAAFRSSRYFRLSAHYTPDISKKFGIKLSPDSSVLPYHGVLIEPLNGLWRIVSKSDVNQDKFVLLHKTVKGIDCPYYKEI